MITIISASESTKKVKIYHVLAAANQGRKLSFICFLNVSGFCKLQMIGFHSSEKWDCVAIDYIELGKTVFEAKLTEQNIMDKLGYKSYIRLRYLPRTFR